MQKQPIIQIACWMLFDGSSAVILTRLKVFNLDLLNYRQRVFAYFLVAIEACMLMTEIISDQETKVVLSASILILSIGALFMDVGFVLLLCLRMIKRVVAGSKTSVLPEKTNLVADLPPLEAKGSLREGSMATGSFKPISPNTMRGNLQLFNKLPTSQVYSVRKVIKSSGKQNSDNSGDLASTARILSSSQIKTSKISLGDSVMGKMASRKLQRLKMGGERLFPALPHQPSEQSGPLEAEGGLSPARAKVISKMSKSSLRKESYS